MKKRLVIVNQDVGYLFIDLANVAVEHYGKVVLLSGSVVELGGRLDPRVQIWNISRYRRHSGFSRFFSWLRSFLQIAWRVRTRFRHYEVLLSSNPPLNTLLPLFCANRMGLYVLDLYPEALYKTGLVAESNPVVRLWRRFNRFAYHRFDSIWALTPSMKSSIERSYGVTVGLIPAWASRLDDSADQGFLRREDLAEAWIVLYSGNLGREHDVEALLGCAKFLYAHEDLLFVFAGEGWKRQSLVRRAELEKLNNVRFLPKLPANKFATLLAHARIGVVTQSLRTADVCIPSKTFNLLAQGLPILGIGKPDSDFGKLIEESGAGRVFLPNEVQRMSEFIASCVVNDAMLQGCRAGARRAAQSYTRANAERLVAHFSERSADD